MESKSKNKNITIYILVILIIICLAYYLGTRHNNSMVYPPTTAPTQLSQGQTYNYTDAKSHEGEYANVTGTIAQIYTSKGTTFFDYCADYKNCPFSAVIFSSDASKFGNLQQYNGKTITINGLIKDYQGKAEIILSDPSQIQK